MQSAPSQRRAGHIGKRVAGFQREGQALGWVGFSGAALFTALVKGAGFSSVRNTPRAKKGQFGIGQRERENRGSENPHP
jgi:hypothetical protein